MSSVIYSPPLVPFNLGVVMAFEVTSHYFLFVPLTLPVIYTLYFHEAVFIFRLIEFPGNRQCIALCIVKQCAKLPSLGYFFKCAEQAPIPTLQMRKLRQS